MVRVLTRRGGIGLAAFRFFGTSSMTKPPSPGSSDASAASRPATNGRPVPLSPTTTPSNETQPPAPLRSKPSKARLWLYRLTALLFAPILVLGLLELSLYLFGFGYSTSFFRDGADLDCADAWIDNLDFARWVFPRDLEPLPRATAFELPKIKKPNVFRICVLGESATLGFPDPSISFPRILEVLLRSQYPSIEFEITNTGMVGINSHVALQIARQCAGQMPDAIVVHLGNNEVVGPFGAAGVLGAFSPSVSVIRTNLAIKATRTGQLLNRLLHAFQSKPDGPKIWGGMAMFVNNRTRADDQERLQPIYASHRTNLEDICRVGEKLGIPVVLCTIPVNLRDCPPFGSLHPPQWQSNEVTNWDKPYQSGVAFEEAKQFAEALLAYDKAAKIDDTYADLAFRMGRCHAALGEWPQAKNCFLRARDLDVLRFRTDSTINQTIREVAAAHAGSGVRLADAEKAFSDISSHGIPGEALFLEHVHMTFAGNYQMATTIFAALLDRPTGILATNRDKHANPIPEARCAELLAHAEWNRWKSLSVIGDRMMKEPPFTLQLDHEADAKRMLDRLASMYKDLQSSGIQKALATQSQAVQTTPGDWMIRMKYADLLSESGNTARAKEQYEASLANLRHNFGAEFMIGNIQLKMQSPQAAEFHFRRALRIEPQNLEVQVGLASALEAQGRTDEALATYQRLVDQTTNRAFGLEALGRFLLRGGKPDEAKACFRDALQREPNHGPSHYNIAAIALRQGNAAEAIEHLNAALKIRPDWPEALALLAEAKKKSAPFVTNGDPSKARRE